MTRTPFFFVALSFVASAALSGCAEAYCQSGPKTGMQCYSLNDVEWQITQTHGEVTDSRSWGQPQVPSPGCVLATPNGLVQQPLPGSGAGTPPPTSYVMSGACASRAQPAYGAIR